MEGLACLPGILLCMLKKPLQESSVTVMVVASALEASWFKIEMFSWNFHFPEIVKQAWFLLWAFLLLCRAHTSVSWTYHNTNYVPYCHNKPHKLNCEWFTSALHTYSGSPDWSPKAWTPKLSESHLCTHPPPNHSPVGITSSLQLQIRSAHCAHFA